MNRPRFLVYYRYTYLFSFRSPLTPKIPMVLCAYYLTTLSRGSSWKGTILLANEKFPFDPYSLHSVTSNIEALFLPFPPLLYKGSSCMALPIEVQRRILIWIRSSPTSQMGFLYVPSDDLIPALMTTRVCQTPFRMVILFDTGSLLLMRRCPFINLYILRIPKSWHGNQGLSDSSCRLFCPRSEHGADLLLNRSSYQTNAIVQRECAKGGLLDSFCLGLAFHLILGCFSFSNW